MCNHLFLSRKDLVYIFSFILISSAVNSQAPLRSVNINTVTSATNNAGATIINAAATNHESIRLTDTSYIDLGNDASLHLTNFTIEAWIKIEGYASSTSSGATGTGGGQDGLIPIITKGRAEQELATADINYFLSYRLSDRKLVADFEDGSSLNHSVTSTAALPMNTWVHVGASFDVATQKWRLFIDNNPAEIFTLTGGPFTPQSLSNVDACIGATLNNAGGIRQGFFNGRIDEVRIWNTALTSLNSGELTTTPANLVGRWALDEGTGTVVANAVSGGPGGVLINKTEWVTGFNVPDTTTDASIRFNGVHDYVSFGAAPTLNTTAFTLEAWIYKEGNGITTNTGSPGIDGVPIIAKGRAESEAGNLNMNYFMGINSSNKLVADFEESTGINHPVTGATSIPNNVWTHVAATYEPVTAVWNLYVNGVADATVDLGSNVNPVSNSIQHASVGSALNSAGLADGFFNGKIDEVRIWNRALSVSELQPNSACTSTNTASLAGYWNFNENGDVTALNSVTGGVNGSLISNNISIHPANGGPSWACNGFTGNYRSKNSTGIWSTATDWEVYNGSAWVTATRQPGYTDNVTIVNGSTYIISNPVSCNNLTVNAGGKLYRANAVNRYITVYGHIVCNGIIGNGSIADGISFSIEGDTCSISGSGTFDCSRIKKTCNSHVKTNLTFNRNVNVRFDGTALYNEQSSTFFNIKIPSGVTVNVPGDGSANSAGNVSIHGTNGIDVGYPAGSLKVDGTLNLSGTGTATSILYLNNYNTFNNANTSWPVSVTIDSGGIINTGIINCTASSASGHSLTIMSGGKLNITGEPSSYIAPSLINNTYTLNPGSIIEYSKPGNQTVYTFGSIHYSNLFCSGSGTKSILSSLGVSDTVKLSGTATLASGGNLTLLSSAAKTARVAELPVNGAGTPLANITGNVTVERFISAKRAWRFLSVPTNNLSQTIHTAWQENKAQGSVTQTTPPGYGTQVTDNSATWASNGFDYFSPAGPSVKKYDKTALPTTWKGIANTAINMNATDGYMTFVRGDRTASGLTATPTTTVLRTTGTLYTGKLSPVIVPAISVDTFTSIGNPYASPLDMRSITKTGGVKDLFILMNPLINTFGAFEYYTFNGTDYETTPGGVVNNYIQSGQAFFVEGGLTSGSIVFNENAKSKSLSALPLMFRPAGSNNIMQNLRTDLYAVNSDGSTYLADGTLINFAGNFSNALDNMDIIKATNFEENFTIKTNNKLLAIESRHAMKLQDTIFFNMTKMKAKSYRLKITGKNFKQNMTAFLEDSYFNNHTPINLRDSTAYDFNVVNDSASWNPDRFRIVFKTPVALPLTFSSVKANRDKGNINVKWTVENELNIKDYEVEKSTDTQQFSTAITGIAALNNSSTDSYNWLDVNVTTGNNYYRIKSIGIYGEVKYSEIVKVFINKLKPTIILCPNPIINGTINVLFNNEPEGSYVIRLLNRSGQTLIVKRLQLDESINKNVEMSIREFAHGTYWLEVTKPDNGKANMKFVY